MKYQTNVTEIITDREEDASVTTTGTQKQQLMTMPQPKM